MTDIVAHAQSSILFLTDRCNLRCRTCPQMTGNYTVNIDDARDSLRKIQWSESNVLYLTGGEPFLENGLIEEILSAVPNSVEVRVLSNGTLLPSPSVMAHKNLKICISLFGCSSASHDTAVGSQVFTKVMDNLYDLARNKVSIEIRHVITEFNYRDLRVFAEFVFRNLPFVSNVAFMGLEIVENALINVQSIWVRPQEFLPMLFEAIDFLQAVAIPVQVLNLPLCYFDEKYYPVVMDSITGWKKWFLDECSDCALKLRCAGFFRSNCELNLSEVFK